MAKDPGGDPLIIRNVEFLGGMAEKHGWRPESPLPEELYVPDDERIATRILRHLMRY